ncbi:Crp/Fnr family transcriptional regulator [Laspinema sp. A4]|uniref:Crp/Fnr family transcriptional regulator n=1 Tax=Laspinema sp. D2d TaxID=2953686 RepID=UPI0021BA534F|nr:Crp/Fnr family transcriptional regulator [Laspinema sp. D2d]MCT7982298.1 Crp/Fnr family transcriptional regulator [Laspinema sp. D2d]
MKDQSFDKPAFLAQTPLFQSLPPDQHQALAQIAIGQSYQKGEVLFWEGEDESVGFFIVISGRVKVFKQSPLGKEQILQIFVAGQHFAEVPAFDGQPFPASAAALESTQVLFFPRTALVALMQAYPNIAITLLGIFARHLRWLAHVVEDLSLKDVPQRLAAYLLYLSDSPQGTLAQVELDITKGQLAAFLGTIPETLSRVFAKLSSEGVLEIEGARIRLLDLSRLRVLAGMSE